VAHDVLEDEFPASRKVEFDLDIVSGTRTSCSVAKSAAALTLGFGNSASAASIRARSSQIMETGPSSA
jgi:hypothetical protein